MWFILVEGRRSSNLSAMTLSTHSDIIVWIGDSNRFQFIHVQLNGRLVQVSWMRVLARCTTTLQARPLSGIASLNYLFTLIISLAILVRSPYDQSHLRLCRRLFTLWFNLFLGWLGACLCRFAYISLSQMNRGHERLTYHLLTVLWVLILVHFTISDFAKLKAVDLDILSDGRGLVSLFISRLVTISCRRCWHWHVFRVLLLLLPSRAFGQQLRRQALHFSLTQRVCVCLLRSGHYTLTRLRVFLLFALLMEGLLNEI